MMERRGINREEIIRMIQEDARPHSCVLCGKCAASCPSFRQLGREIYSPRGRMALISAFLKGDLVPGDPFLSSLFFCLGCGACEESCPARVRPRWAILLLKNLPEFQELHKQFRKSLMDAEKGDFPLALLKSFPDHPERVSKSFHERLHAILRPPARPLQKIIYVPGCVRKYMLPDSWEAAVILLQKIGCEALVPESISCCGAFPVFVGELGLARNYARENMKLFQGAGDIPILCDCASCALAIKSYPLWFPPDTKDRENADMISPRVYLLSDFLSRSRLSYEGHPSQEGIRMVYMDSCALSHGLGVKSSPRKFLDRLPGVKRLEIPGDVCCPGWAMGILQENQEFLDQLCYQKILNFCAREKVNALVMEDSVCEFLLSQKSLPFPVLSFAQFVGRILTPLWKTHGIAQNPG